MRRRFRLFALLCLALLPAWLKRPLYRWGFGYRIGRGARIGVAILDCASLSVGDQASIGHGTVFWRCGETQIGAHVRIGFLNLFRGGDRITLDDYAEVIRLNVVNAIPENDAATDSAAVFHLGYGAVVTAEHRIDFTDRVTIGRRSILGGRNSSIWTHNRRSGVPVTIGDHCYIGSEIRMAPGARIPDCCIVGIGAVVTGPHETPYSLLAGVPARRVRELTDEDRELIFGKTRRDLPDSEGEG